MSPVVEEYLMNKGVNFKAHRHEPIVSFEDAQAVLPFDPKWMVKGLAFQLPGGRYAIVALRASDRANYKKISDALGVRRADLRMADAESLRADLDMQVGGIVPLPINSAVVLFDRGVLSLDVVICGTGRNDHSLEIKARDLVEASCAEIGDFVKEPENV